MTRTNILAMIMALLFTLPVTSTVNAATSTSENRAHGVVNGPEANGRLAWDCVQPAAYSVASGQEDCYQVQATGSQIAAAPPGITGTIDAERGQPFAQRNNAAATVDTHTASGNTPAPAPTPVPEPESGANTARTSMLLLAPVGDFIRIRTHPVDGQVIDHVSRGDVVQAVEPFETAYQKIGVTGQWVAVRTPDGTEGYTAAWLYRVAEDAPPETASDTVILTDSSSPQLTSRAKALFIRAISDEIRIRSRPVDGQIVGVVARGAVVQVVEPVEAARTKIGTSDQWVQVRTPDGTEGYTAAWLYTVEETAASEVVTISLESTDLPVEAFGDVPTSLFLLPTGNNIRIRAAPIDGQVVGVVAKGELVAVVEPAEFAIPKIGMNGQWVQVRTADGVEGFTAAWLYTIAEIPQPDAQSALQPLDASAGIPSLEIIGEENSDEVMATGPIPPLPNSIADLDVPTSSVEAGEGEAQLGLVLPESNAVDSSVSIALPETPSPSVDVAPDSPADAEQSSSLNNTGSNMPSTEIFNPIVPITVDVADDISVQSAEMAINNYTLASFTEEPYAYDLDTTILSDGEYRLTFSVIRDDGIVLSDDLYFEVTVEDDLLADVFADTETETDAAVTAVGPAAPTTNADDARRVITIDGIERPFDLQFSSEDGLVPVEIEAPENSTADNNGPDSLKDVLTTPLVTVIPGPVRTFLGTERPTLSAIIIIAMVLLLLPQGLFTLYWMTYTWNNPEVADQYSSPREFTEPQYSFTALLPARREKSVIKDTIRTIDRINYPEHLKEILILIRDEDDDDTIQAAREAIEELGKDSIRLITFTDGPRNKPNGLNKGLREATKDVVCIFDAEDEPHADIYNVVNTVMVRDEADVVQSGVQLMNFRSSWFSAFNVLEYFFWFKSGLHAFTRKFHVTPLGGNTVFFKRHWLERLGGWDDQCLTEDADVGLRLTQMGAKIQIVYDAEHATQEETPDTVESFIKQRTRWCQGFYQIFFKGDWARLPSFKQKVVALYILLNSLFQAMQILFLPIGLYIALTQDIPVPVALLSYVPIYLLLLQMITSLVGIREFTKAYDEPLPLFFRLRMIIFYYPYQLLLSMAAFRAVIRLLARQQSWEKTAHSNLHRQSQLSGVVSS